MELCRRCVEVLSEIVTVWSMPEPTRILPRMHPIWGWFLPLLTLFLQSIIYLGMNWETPGIDWWFLTFVCLVPWTVWVVLVPGRWTAHLGSYLLGVAFYAVNMYSIRQITPDGYDGLCFYYGMFYWLYGGLVREIYRRLGWSLVAIVPVVWVATEQLRSVGPLAFPFMFLAHGNYQRLVLIQISDVTGAVGVSFVVAMINGLLASVWLHYRRPPAVRGTGRCLVRPAVATLIVLAGTLLYGSIQLYRGTMRAGPRVAVIQGDYPSTVPSSDAQEGPTESDKARTYFQLMEQAAEFHPDLFLFPETPWMMYLNDEYLKTTSVDTKYRRYLLFQETSRLFDQIFREQARRYSATVVVGAASIEFYQTVIFPCRKYNSAFVYSPRADGKSRYDKVKLVVFGEFTPFRYWPYGLHTLYRWLDSFNPFSLPEDEFSLVAGKTFTSFEMTDVHNRTYRFGIPICFEDLLPEVSRRFTLGPDGQKQVDFLLSMSNDGWFNHSAIVPQHLAVCAFRAVENRVGIARSVNTACSGFVDPNGRIHDVVRVHGRSLGRGLFGYSVAHVGVDSRLTWYTRYGDWFGYLCSILCALLLLLALIKRRSAVKNIHSADSQTR